MAFPFSLPFTTFSARDRQVVEDNSQEHSKQKMLVQSPATPKTNQTTWGQIWDIMFVYTCDIYYLLFIMMCRAEVFELPHSQDLLYSPVFVLCLRWVSEKILIPRWTWKLHWKKPSKSLVDREWRSLGWDWATGGRHRGFPLCTVTTIELTLCCFQNQDSVEGRKWCGYPE